MKKNIIKIDPAIGLFLFFAIIILWRLLLPGYVLTLDMVFMPHFHAFDVRGLNNAVLPNFLMFIMSLAMPMWAVQKIILLFLFFCLGYLPYRFMPGISNRYARIFAGIFYLFNPFVYERFIAGQWMLLFAYALLPVFLYSLERFRRRPELESSILIGVVSFLIACFSPHFFVISFLISIVWFIFLAYAEKGSQKPAIRYVFTAVFVMLAINSFWMIPLLGPSGNAQINYDKNHLIAFSSAADQRFGAELNILMLYGFWGEHEPWINGFWLPKDSQICLFGGLILGLLILYGIARTLKEKDFLAKYFFTLLLLAFFLSLGISAAFPLLRVAMEWLLLNVPFFSGFRDSQKWSSILVCSYVFFASKGIEAMAGKLKKVSLDFYLAIFFSTLAVIYSFAMPGGFGRQLYSVWYPPEWSNADVFLNKNMGFGEKAIFLPWHGYLTFSFNFNVLTANMTEGMFTSNVVASRNMEIGLAENSQDDLRKNITKLMDNNAKPEQIIEFLAKNKIKYIIFYDKNMLEDPYYYRFLDDSKLEKVWQEGSLTIFKNMLI